MVSSWARIRSAMGTTMRASPRKERKMKEFIRKEWNEIERSMMTES